MKVPGLSGQRNNNQTIKPGEWYLLIVRAAQFTDRNRRFDVTFGLLENENAVFVDSFFLTDKAVSRLYCFLSRAGYPQELLTADDVEPAKVIGLRVWALLGEREFRGEKTLCTAGWNFRSESDPPEELAVIDYTQEGAEWDDDI